MLPVAAVGGAAGAVGGMADSGFMVRITRGRLWIGLLGSLLIGIVALNVWGLGMSASTSATAGKIDELERQISVQKARIAKRSSTSRVEAGASASLGLGVPSADAVRYVKYKPKTAAAAAERLASGQISVLSGMVAPEFADVAVAPAEGTVDPAAVAPVTPAEPTAEDTAPIEPVVPPTPETPVDPAAAVTPAPATTDPAADPAAGGIGP